VRPKAVKKPMLPRRCTASIKFVSKSQSSFFLEIEKLILTFIWKSQQIPNSQNSLEKEEQVVPIMMEHTCNPST
jgi:hypothetical protein